MMLCIVSNVRTQLYIRNERTRVRNYLTNEQLTRVSGHLAGGNEIHPKGGVCTRIPNGSIHDSVQFDLGDTDWENFRGLSGPRLSAYLYRSPSGSSRLDGDQLGSSLENVLGTWRRTCATARSPRLDEGGDHATYRYGRMWEPSMR
jgi:hypothetical protein